MMTLTTLASGSSGNCLLLSCGSTHLLVDAGISARRITRSLQALGLTADDLSGILITHEHSDHISGVATLTKHHAIPIYTAAATGRQLTYRIPFLDDLIRPVSPGVPFAVGDAEVTSFSTLHDAASPMGYAFSDGQHKAAVVTDLGIVTEEVTSAVRGAQLLVAEANHDPDLLRSGPYPYQLKARILGDHGHLSNSACAELCAGAEEWGVRRIVLAHLSLENNRPSLARSAVESALSSPIPVSVAPREEAGPTYSVGE